jgi:Zn-dependent protease
MLVYKRNSKFLDPIFTIMSLAALAAVNYSILHSPIVFLAIAVLVAHEFAHYFAARKYTKSVNLPLFLPFPFLLIGFTRSKDLTYDQRSKVALAGPVAGFIVALSFYFANLFFRFFSSKVLAFVAFFEIFNNLIIGSDGKKYRKYKKLSKINS